MFEDEKLIAAHKAKLRRVAKLARAQAHCEHGDSVGGHLARQGLDFLGSAKPAPRCVVSGFWAIRDEIDCIPLLTRLSDEGYRCALPRMIGRDRPLVFRSWSPGDALVGTTWGIMEPAESAPILVPDIVLVPLLAFDDRGYRLGYGGGFYDRSLDEIRKSKPVIAVGIAFDEQKVDAIPHNAYDQPLDWVLTPSGPERCTGP